MSSVLLVGYWHPPTPGAAAQRLTAFASHLPEFGWDVRVLTAGVADNHADSHIFRIADVGPSTATPFADYVWPVHAQRRLTPRGWVYPDRFLLWRRRAFRAALNRIERPSVVFASFPPASAAALGVDLAQAWGVPLVLEYRDLWFGPGGYAPPTLLHDWLHRRLERRLTRAAAQIVAVSERMADELAHRHDIDRRCVHAIPNGCEPFDAKSESTSASSSGFTLAHVGTVIHRNRPDLFLDALERTEHKERWRAAGLRIRFVGNLSNLVVRRPEFTGWLESTGLVSAQRARQEMRAADALLLLVGDYVGQWGHNAKLFDYLATGRPILCLEESPGSNDRILLESLARDRCVFAALADHAAVVTGIDAVQRLADSLGRTPLEAPPGLDAYSRRAGAKILAGVLALAREGR